MQQSTPYLSFHGITMTFPGVKALSDISFGCYAGQVHALMGENGAGKSTLLKILSGNYIPTAGSLQIRGQQMTFNHTTEALNAGVARFGLPGSSIGVNVNNLFDREYVSSCYSEYACYWGAERQVVATATFRF